MKELLSLHGSLKSLSGRLMIPSTPPVAALINIWKLIANQALTVPQEENTFVESVVYNGENLIYKNQGHNAVIKIIDSGLNKYLMLEYTIEFETGAREKVSREYLSQPENPDVASLPTTFPKVQEAAKQLSDQDLASILHPISLNPAEQEFIDMHHQLFHLPYSIISLLLKAGLLPKQFLRLKD